MDDYDPKYDNIFIIKEDIVFYYKPNRKPDSVIKTCSGSIENTINIWFEEQILEEVGSSLFHFQLFDDTLIVKDIRKNKINRLVREINICTETDGVVIRTLVDRYLEYLLLKQIKEQSWD